MKQRFWFCWMGGIRLKRGVAIGRLQMLHVLWLLWWCNSSRSTSTAQSRKRKHSNWVILIIRWPALFVMIPSLLLLWIPHCTSALNSRKSMLCPFMLPERCVLWTTRSRPTFWLAITFIHTVRLSVRQRLFLKLPLFSILLRTSLERAPEVGGLTSTFSTMDLLLIQDRRSTTFGPCCKRVRPEPDGVQSVSRSVLLQERKGPFLFDTRSLPETRQNQQPLHS